MVKKTRTLSGALPRVALWVLGVAPLAGCHAALPLTRAALAVTFGTSDAMSSRSGLREQAAESFGCAPDDVELESMTDGYVAKGCGQFQHFTCRGENAYGWHSCSGDPPVKLPPVVSSTTGPYAADVKVARDAIVLVLTREGSPTAAPFTLTTPPELLAPRRWLDARTDTSGVARIDARLAMSRLFREDGVSPLDERMPDLLFEVDGQRIDAHAALEPLHSAWLRDVKARRAVIVDEEIRTGTCTAAREAAMQAAVTELTARFGPIERVMNVRVETAVATPQGTDVALDVWLDEPLDVVVISGEPASLTRATSARSKHEQAAAGWYTASIETTFTHDRPPTVKLEGRGCTAVVAIRQ